MNWKEQSNITKTKWINRQIWSLILSCTPISTIKNLLETLQWYDRLTWRELYLKEKIRKTWSSIISIIWRIRVGMMIDEQKHYIDPKIEIVLRQILGIGTQIIWIYHSGELKNIIQLYKSSIYTTTTNMTKKWKKLYSKVHKKFNNNT
jgi:hypothetical protein